MGQCDRQAMPCRLTVQCGQQRHKEKIKGMSTKAYFFTALRERDTHSLNEILTTRDITSKCSDEPLSSLRQSLTSASGQFDHQRRGNAFLMRVAPGAKRARCYCRHLTEGCAPSRQLVEVDEVRRADELGDRARPHWSLGRRLGELCARRDCSARLLLLCAAADPSFGVCAARRRSSLRRGLVW